MMIVPFNMHFGYHGSWMLATSIIIGYNNNTFHVRLLDHYRILVNTKRTTSKYCPKITQCIRN